MINCHFVGSTAEPCLAATDGRKYGNSPAKAENCIFFVTLYSGELFRYVFFLSYGFDAVACQPAGVHPTK